ncbi:MULTISPECIES: D-arabinono-1,4-lactone oxidase [unclassified Actinotalea]|uniref:D-arabinono-1,4-lactone oxidase n=1 Tax=unclassified Actinotalea TaxID=2638618 RepID=UPI0015F71944|nr:MULTISPECIES: D-arabinono-1,4-lactone oxidase [unclassified Actinotalea]
MTTPGRTPAGRPSTRRARPGPGTWRNWSGTATAQAQRFWRPRDEDDVVRAVRWAARAGLRVRAVGGGHSFTPAAVTDGVLLSLDHLAAVGSLAPQPDGSTHVTVGAGIRLRALNRELAARGLALENLGDIDRQSIAGAVSTGTHGTGARLGGLATQVVGVRLVGADGEVREADASRDPGLFEAARLGLGTLGVLTALTLRAVPAFSLLAREETWDLDDALDAMDGPDGWVATTDHVDVYWFPFTRRALVKRNQRVPAGTGPALGTARRLVDDELMQNGVFGLTNRLAAAMPRAVPAINAVAARALSDRTYAAPSADVFVSPRRVVFREMEYAVPRAALRDVVGEIDAWLRRTREPVPFPVEVRVTAPDDVWLSTAHGRESAYVAVHQYHRLPHERYFDAVEAICADVDGRPHWGKLHGLGADRLSALYPRFDDFRAVRAEHDPGGLFRNAYTDRVLGPAS